VGTLSLAAPALAQAQKPAAGGTAAGGTKVQTKQLQQMFQSQSAQNQAQAAANAQNYGGQAGAAQGAAQKFAPGQAQQPSAQQPLAQQQLSQGQGVVNQGQPGQAQSAAGGSNSGQKPVQVPLTPEQAAAIQAAQQAAIAGGGVNPVPPFEPLTDEWKQWLDQVLTRWETASGQVEKFQCEFTRFQYDPTIVSPDHYTVAQGDLKYMRPDKGLLMVKTMAYHSGKDDKGQPKYEENAKRPFGEYWICDGQNVYDMNRNDKVCTIVQLPPNMRGVGIQASPLPFVFGVKKQDLLARYWIKPLPQPEGRKNEIWLEVFPRRADDASNYLKLQVVLDLRDWMPMGLIVFRPSWTPQTPHRELYQFDKRVVNAKNILPAIFQKEFIPAKPPADWKVVEEKFQEPQAEQPAAEPRVATPPQPGQPVVK
jgi:TIGR03009 family protein